MGKANFLVSMKPGGNSTLECGGMPVNSCFSRVLKRKEACAENERQR